MALSEEDVPNFNDTLQAMYQEDEDENPHNNQIIVKTIVVVTLVLVNIGNAMLLGVIHFEKYGQDPMKRSFPDRMFANCCWLHVYISFTNCLIEQYRALIGRFLFDPFSILKILDKRKFVFFRTCWNATNLDCTLQSQHILDFVSVGLRRKRNVQMPLDIQLEKMCCN